MGNQTTRARPAQAFTGGQRRSLVKRIRAAVVVQEDEPLGWFTWEVPRDTVRRLLATGKLVRPAAGWVGVA